MKQTTFRTYDLADVASGDIAPGDRVWWRAQDRFTRMTIMRYGVVIGISENLVHVLPDREGAPVTLDAARVHIHL